MILLDTNALIFLEQGHVRTRALAQRRVRLYISPASLLELQYLNEAGRVRLRGASISELANRDDLWLLDDPPSARWFDTAMEYGWMRDPFDRLIVAHARLRRWQLATADAQLLNKLPERERLAI